MVKPLANLKNIDKDEDMKWAEHSPGFSLADVWAREDPKVGPNDERRYVNVQAYKLEQGKRSEAHFHESHFELVMVWRGKGLARYGTAADGEWRIGSPLTLEPFDTIAIPPRTLHEFEADAGGEPLVLITVHALNDQRLETTRATFGSRPDPRELEKRSVGDLGAKPGNWEPSKYRAKRIRVWGKEARVEEVKGEDTCLPVDANKGQFHFTLYTFNPTQANPGHFHPHSIEFVFALTNRVEFSVRPKLALGGWDSPGDVQEKLLEPGDMVLVPLAGWHQYVNRSETEQSMVMAMQSPHPVMHTLLFETDGDFDPQKSTEQGGAHVL
jgi:quercetin dioxygenase-like cupin family protein